MNKQTEDALVAALGTNTLSVDIDKVIGALGKTETLIAGAIELDLLHKEALERMGADATRQYSANTAMTALKEVLTLIAKARAALKGLAAAHKKATGDTISQKKECFTLVEEHWQNVLELIATAAKWREDLEKDLLNRTVDLRKDVHRLLCSYCFAVADALVSIYEAINEVADVFGKVADNPALKS